MGCCVSTPKKPAPGNPKRPLPPPTPHLVSKSPPRAEDEAVKEVLSETPLVLPLPTNPDPDPNPNPNPTPNPYYFTPIPKINHANGFATNRRTSSPRKHPPSLLSEITKLPPPDPKPLSPPSPSATASAVTPDEISEISCLSETVSTERAPRSPARIHKPAADPALRRERLTGKSPVRRPDPSPRRREAGQAVVRNRVGVGPLTGDGGQRKREPGENSRRRSRSPVVSRSNVGRSPSGRKAGLSPGRARMVQPDAGAGDGCERKTGDDEWDPNPTVPSESLENPLVSLECFIFL